MSTEQQPSDAELISAVRGGDTTAYGELFSRHVEAARRLARQLASAGDVEDLVSEAFAKVLTIVQRGGGPDLAFRAYLLTAVRSLHIDSVRGAARLRPVDDFTPFDTGVPFRDTAVEGFENQAAARAFATLPERWQLVLWHTEVEGQKPADVAQLLGMSANSVSALAYRAREGLRQAFLNMHAQDAEDDVCAWTQDNLGAYIRNAASKRDSVKVRAHIDECRRCMGIYLELSEVNTNLSGVLGPLVLGSAAAGYIAAAVGGAAAQGGGLLGFIGAHTTAVAVSGVAAAVVVIMGLVLGLNRSEPPTETAEPPVNTAPSVTQALLPGARIDKSETPTDNGGPTADTPAAPATSAPVDPSDAPTDNPSPLDPTKAPDSEIETAENDVTVDVAVREPDDGKRTVHIAVDGLEDGSGTLLVRPSRSDKRVVIIEDPSCDAVSGGSFRCELSADTPDSFRFTVLVGPDSPSTDIDVEVRPAPGVEDADQSNNTDSKVVAPPAPVVPDEEAPANDVPAEEAPADDVPAVRPGAAA